MGNKKEIYAKYYAAQAGGSLPVFYGAHKMQGHGFADFMGKIWKFLSPIVTPTLKTMRDEGIKSGIQVLSDLQRDVPLQTSVKSHAKSATQNVLASTLKRLQSGSGSNINKKRRCKSSQSLRGRRKDIFSSS
jgi:hypothetical protein